MDNWIYWVIKRENVWWVGWGLGFRIDIWGLFDYSFLVVKYKKVEDFCGGKVNKMDIDGEKETKWG